MQRALERHGPERAIPQPGYAPTMYVSMSHLRVAPERADELIAAFRDRVGLVDAFDGFEGLEVTMSPHDERVATGQPAGGRDGAAGDGDSR